MATDDERSGAETGPVTAAAMEALISRLPGVLRSRVVLNDAGIVEEIHVLAAERRPAKQVVRDIESALAATFDVRIDHKCVSVALLKDDEPSPGPPAVRLLSYQVDLMPGEGRMEAGVRLEVLGPDPFTVEGRQAMRYLPSQRLHTVVGAVIEALGQLPDLFPPLGLRDVQTTTLAGQSVVLVGLAYLGPRRREELALGVAPVRGDVHRAAAEAALDAYDRDVRQRGRERVPAFGSGPVVLP